MKHKDPLIPDLIGSLSPQAVEAFRDLYKKETGEELPVLDSKKVAEGIFAIYLLRERRKAQDAERGIVWEGAPPEKRVPVSFFARVRTLYSRIRRSTPKNLPSAVVSQRQIKIFPFHPRDVPGAPCGLQ